MSKQEILNNLEPLFKKAKEDGLWFYTRYYDLWFSPKELRENHKNEKFIWDAVNWELRDPMERIKQINNIIRNHIKEKENIYNRINENYLYIKK